MKTSNPVQMTIDYALQIKQFTKSDWITYVLWVGLMFGLFFSTFTFVLVGHQAGAPFPAYVYNIPLGVLIFVLAISFDTIGHRTTYKEFLKKGEDLVHHITIFAGITSCLLLCLAYSYPVFLKFPVITMVVLSIFYSVIDEALHWYRYLLKYSDPVEMWSHFFIFVGHLWFILPWVYWYLEGYQGVAETLEHLPSLL